MPDSIAGANAIRSILQALECELHGPKSRADRERLAALLHPEFHEFGRSGRAYTREQILGLLLAETEPVEVHAQDFALTMLAEEVGLLRYRSAHVAASGALVNFTHRSSIWRLGPTGWQMIFHQGTPTQAFARNTI